MSESASALTNQRFLDQVTADDPGMLKKASDSVNAFTRMKMREDGFSRRVLPPIDISNDDLDRQVDTDKPVKVVDKEPGSPGALMVPFATTPMGRYIKGARYRVMFARIQSPKFTKDVDELRTYHMDIRQIISDNAIKDMLAEEDGKFIGAVNGVVSNGGTTAVNAAVTETGSVQWKSIAGGVTRVNIAESLKVLPSTPSHLETATALVNNITVKDILKWHRSEVGGDLAQELLIKGFTEQVLMGVKYMITIKRDLVPDSTCYYFAEPKFLGKFYMLEDTTMFMDRRAYTLEFFCYESLGAAIGNVAGCARIDFTA